MRFKDKNIIVGSYVLLFLILIIFVILQFKYIALLVLILIFVESFVIIVSFLKEKKNVMNTFDVYAKDNNFQEAILYLQQLSNKNLYPGTRLMINSLIILSYINLGMYDEAYNIISKINWHNITYIYFGYYSILLNLYFDNVLEAKRIFKSLEKTRNKHLNNQIVISSELLKIVDGNNFDREIINNSKLNLVILVCEKYGK